MPRSDARDSWILPALKPHLTEEQIAQLIEQSVESIWEAVVQREWLDDKTVLMLVSTHFGMRAAPLDSLGTQGRELLPETLARRYKVLCCDSGEGWIAIATANPNDLDCERAIGFATGRRVRMLLASPLVIAARTDELYRPENVVERLLENVSAKYEVEAIQEDLDDAAMEITGEGEGERPIMRLVDYILAEGIAQRASDVHVEAEETEITVKYRIDGVLRQVMNLPRAVGVPLVSRIKIMSGLDIADRLRPQDGRARVAVNGIPVDLRISTLPAAHGEKVVVRILDQRAMVMSLDKIGLRADEQERLRSLIEMREGFVLVTGPTGSGKTTTLYSVLRRVLERKVNIITVEDPVEYRIPGIVQVQVNEKAGLTFATALRSILRQDPDVVLVGEIRDRETASIAVQAALTGHLVLSTLHTIDAASTITRLSDIGVDAYKIAAALKGVIAQRLVRRLCPTCRRESTSPVSGRLRRWIPDGTTLYEPVGCPDCSQTGYRGRVAVVEVLTITHEIERLIATGAPAVRITAAAREAGMRSLWDAAIGHALTGATSLDEVIRVLDVPRDEEATAATTSPAVEPVTRVAIREPAVLGPEPPKSSTMVPVGGAAFELLDADLPDDDEADDGRISVLLVDDEDGLRKALRDVLEDEGFRVYDARDGAEAIEQVDRHAPDVIVLDLMLPQVDGFEVLRMLRAREATVNTRVIVLTAHGDEDSEVRVFKAGADDFLAKPFRARALSARIRALAARA
jgi:type II secretory ATPase GspE/PulE/Tfp pilus assembly ATPase PilB-like protein/ActR/RegA family two-component response regulator